MTAPNDFDWTDRISEPNMDYTWEDWFDEFTVRLEDEDEH